MRNRVVVLTAAMGLALSLSISVKAQNAETGQAPQHGVAQRGASIYGQLGKDSGGPAPKHDLTGVWAGGGGGRAAAPPWEQLMTPWGKARFALNKPEGTNSQYSVAEANDPTRTCDPVGFPRNILWNNRAMTLAQMPDRVVELFQYQKVWREIFTDGRELPKDIGAGNGQDWRYYGYSVGHWDGDFTLMVDTVGTDERTWLDNSGHPHSNDLRVQEQYTRTDRNDMELTVTLNDPVAYTKPFVAMKSNFRWLPKQQFEEQLCIPSEGLAYLSIIGDPAGNADGSSATH